VLAQIGRVLARVEIELYPSYGKAVRQLRLIKRPSGGPNAKWSLRATSS
jgi:hypothetical protein